MSFIQAAATFKVNVNHDPNNSIDSSTDESESKHLEETALEAFELLSQMLSRRDDLALREVADIF
jgi:hypothetical protein